MGAGAPCPPFSTEQPRAFLENPNAVRMFDLKRAIVVCSLLCHYFPRVSQAEQHGGGWRLRIGMHLSCTGALGHAVPATARHPVLLTLTPKRPGAQLSFKMRKGSSSPPRATLRTQPCCKSLPCPIARTVWSTPSTLSVRRARTHTAPLAPPLPFLSDPARGFLLVFDPLNTGHLAICNTELLRRRPALQLLEKGLSAAQASTQIAVLRVIDVRWQKGRVGAGWGKA